MFEYLAIVSILVISAVGGVIVGEADASSRLVWMWRIAVLLIGFILVSRNDK